MKDNNVWWWCDSVALRRSSRRLWAERMPAEALMCGQMIRADERQLSQGKKKNVGWIWQLQPPDLQVTQNPVCFWSFTLRNHCCVGHPNPPNTSHHLSCWWSFTFGFVLLRPWQACEWCVCRDALTRVCPNSHALTPVWDVAEAAGSNRGI